MSTDTILFRKTAFGGFNKDDVLNYIERMKREFYDYRAQVEETVRDLQEKLSEMRESESAAQTEGAALSDSAMDINGAAAHLKEVTDEVCENLTRLLCKLQNQSEDAPEEAAEEPEDAVQPAEPKQDETPESDDPVESILRGLFDCMPQEEPKAPVAAVLTDAELIDSLLPNYLR